MRRKTPVRALVEGMVAGAIGAGVRSLFVRATRKVTPEPPKDAFVPPFTHYAGWGGLYGIVRASYPRLWSARGVLAFSVGVWTLGRPHRYRLRPEAHALAADLAYGAGVAGTLLAADNATFLTVVAALALARGRSAGERALERTRAMVPRELVEGPRHLAAAIARRARDLSN